MGVVILNRDEELLQFLDPELLEGTETISQYGLRSIKLTYTFQDFLKEKELFRQGNKIWVSNDNNLTDCLYVINTEVEQDIYAENSFTVEAEEVLVELNYAPLFSQTELTSSNGFTLTTLNGQPNVTVNWNALNYWFGAYFNIGIVQDCLNDLVSNIPITGTVNRMELLRYIEEHTGNIFVTRYEKDLLDNTIHRYLDFLNPQADLKPWTLNLQYDFVDTSPATWYQGNIIEHEEDEDDDPETNPFTTADPELIDGPDEDWYTPEAKTEYNVTPDNIKFQIRDLNGEVIQTETNPLEWDGAEYQIFDGSVNVVIQLAWTGTGFGVGISEKSYAVVTEGVVPPAYVDTWASTGDPIEAVIPDGCTFVIYDENTDTLLFETELNYRLGSAHNEVLYFSANVENIAFDIDETDTYNALAPVIENSNNGYTRSQLNTLINNFLDLEVSKGELIPLTLEKVNVEGTSLSNATSSLGTFNVQTNYFSRPIKPSDNTTSTPKTFEFYKATSYTRASFTKYPSSLNLLVDEDTRANYHTVKERPDTRAGQGVLAHEKIGTVKTSDDEVYLIYNKVSEELMKKKSPDIEITVDVANLKDHKYNNYDVWDKVYVKIPGDEELVTARVSKVTRELHNPANNKVTLDNYSILQNAMQKMTYIEASNESFDYSVKKTVIATLTNADYNSSDPYSIEHPANQMITLRLYKYEKNKSSLFKTYNKITDVNGQVQVALKLDPADYDLKISYYGDEEYLDCEATIKVNVTGTKNVATKKTTKKTKSKTVSKTKENHKNKHEVKRYYSKYGVSPDKKFILAVGKRSVASDPGTDTVFYETQYRNYCPHCGRSTLVYGYKWAKKNRDVGYFSGTKTNEHYSTKGMIFCTNCKHKYSVLGNEAASSNPLKLMVATATKKVAATKADQLIAGKIYYDSIWVKNKKKKVATTKTWPRVHSTGLPKVYINIAYKIVGDKVGVDAAKAIANWVTYNVIWENYPNFKRNPYKVYKKRKGNCCDQTRLMVTLMDAAGLLGYYRINWVHVTKGNSGHIFAKLKTRATGKWRYVDPCKRSGAGPWGHYVTGYGHAPGRQNKYTGWGSKPTGMGG